MTSKRLVSAVAAAALTLLAIPAFAAPTLKADVVVDGDIVTAGDMFTDAGQFADDGLFRAPAPGTAGIVRIEAVRNAAARIGLAVFDDAGIGTVRVARSGVAVTSAMLTGLMEQDLADRGIISGNMGARIEIDGSLAGTEAAAVKEPVRLVTMRYLPASAGFTARFMLAGHDQPLDVSGRITLLVAAPHLTASLPAGAILTAGDIEMRMVPRALAREAGPAELDQLVGKQLNRQSRAGMMLRVSDVSEPELVTRNEAVTVYLHTGALTLTLKGRALNAAAKGEAVSVLNPTSHKILHGTAVSPATVTIQSGPLSVAGL